MIFEYWDWPLGLRNYEPYEAFGHLHAVRCVGLGRIGQSDGHHVPQGQKLGRKDNDVCPQIPVRGYSSVTGDDNPRNGWRVRMWARHGLHVRRSL